MIDIFNKRWHGIKAEALGEPGKYEMVVIRVHTTDKGPWQSLTEPEVALLLSEHNKIIHQNEKKPIKPAPTLRDKLSKANLLKKKGKKK